MSRYQGRRQYCNAPSRDLRLIRYAMTSSCSSRDTTQAQTLLDSWPRESRLSDCH